MNNSPYFYVKIIKHTPLLFGDNYHDMFHKNKIGTVILVRETPHEGVYYECKTGESILKTDCEKINK